MTSRLGILLALSLFIFTQCKNKDESTNKQLVLTKELVQELYKSQLKQGLESCLIKIKEAYPQFSDEKIYNFCLCMDEKYPKYVTYEYFEKTFINLTDEKSVELASKNLIEEFYLVYGDSCVTELTGKK